VLHPDGRTTPPPDSPQPRSRASPVGAHNPDALSTQNDEPDQAGAPPGSSAVALAQHGAHTAMRSAVSEPDQALEGMGGAVAAPQAQEHEVRARPECLEVAAGEPVAAMAATHQEALERTRPGSGDAAPAPAGDSVRGTALGGANRNPDTNPRDAAALPPELPAEVAALATRVTELAEAQDAAARAAVAQHHQVPL